MNAKEIKITLKEAIEKEGKDELFNKLIKGDFIAEGVFFQEHMTEAQANAEDFQKIPRSVWINYDLDDKTDKATYTLKVYEDLNYEGSQTAFQSYHSIYVLMPNTKKNFEQKQTRVHVHHETIGKIALQLRKDLERPPKSDEVWAYFYKNWEDIDSVIDMDDRKIVFTTTTGGEKEIKKDTFRNIVSEYLTGQKELN
jgi:hypothetical protein